MAALFAKFAERSHSVDGSPTPLPGASHRCMDYASLCNPPSLCLPTPAHLPMKTASKTSPPLSSAGHSQQMGFIFSFLFRSISKLETNLLPTSSELSTNTFSPDRFWSKLSASFQPEPKTMSPLVSPKACGPVWMVHVLQQHPGQGLKPGATPVISHEDKGRASRQPS